MKGTYLKHIKYSFRVDLSQKKALKFVRYIAIQIGMTPVLTKLVVLAPGFDVVCVLKESHIYLTYWKEIGLCIMDVFSCKDFDSKIVSEHIKRILDVDKVLEIEVMKWSVYTEVRKLSG